MLLAQTGASPPILEGLPGPGMKPPADPELHGGGAAPLEQLIQREAQQLQPEEGFTAGHHGQHHGQHEDGQGEGTAQAQQPAPVGQLCSPVICSKRPAMLHFDFQPFFYCS